MMVERKTHMRTEFNDDIWRIFFRLEKGHFETTDKSWIDITPPSWAKKNVRNISTFQFPQ